jgi:thioredoxin-dependent peroxiredoxin
VQVIGASVDKPAATAAWVRKYDLRMPLICDVDYAISAAFGVARPMVGVAKRTTFIIEPDGTLAKTYPKVTAKGHAAKVLADVKALQAGCQSRPDRDRWSH